MIDFKATDIVLLNRKGSSGSWFSSLQRFFTKKPYTHCAVGCGQVCGMQSVISSNELFTVEPIKKYFDEVDTALEIYSVEGMNLFQLQCKINEIYRDNISTWYGIAQCLWFIYRWFMESVFRKDVRKQKNWFPNNTICAEMLYEYLYEIALKYPNRLVARRLKDRLNEWNKDTVNAGDCADVIHEFPEIFKLKFQRP